MNRSLLAIAALSALLPNKLFAAEHDNPFIAPLWYQVEVLIFEQNANYGGEQAPRDVQLSFPENWRYLIDPNAPSEEQQLDALTEALSQEINNLESGLAPDLLTDNVTDHSGAASEPETPQLQLEAPYILLGKQDRILNESAAAINRREKYRVLFHQAWRQPALGEEDSWIVIKGGDSFSDRQQLEGSLRLIKTRFLHMEADLWLSRFDRSRSASEPKATDNTISFINVDETAQTDRQQLRVILPPYPSAPEPTLEAGVMLTAEEPSATDDLANGDLSNGDWVRFDEVEIESELAVEPASYPIEELWPVSQSRRVETDKEYYLDHPRLGILLRISDYEPKVLNSPAEEAAPIN